MQKLVFLICLSMLTACTGSPTKPPTVDGKNRNAVNNDKTVLMLDFQADLIEDNEKIQEHHPVATSVLPASQTLIVHFPFNSAHLQLTSIQEATIMALLANASRIEIRGRTDAKHPSEGDEKIALKRAHAAMNYLLIRGAPISKISINYLSGGNYIADNYSLAGRAQNRRVEIEFFRQP